MRVALALLLLGPAAAGAQQWSYAGESGPSGWGAASPAWAACGTGTQQSPVNIPPDAPRGGAPLVWASVPMRATLRNTGHTLQADFDGAEELVLDGTRYTLAQVHLHAASEHTLGGVHAAAPGKTGDTRPVAAPVQVAARDLPVFTTLYPGSNRPPQPMGERRFLP